VKKLKPLFIALLGGGGVYLFGGELLRALLWISFFFIVGLGALAYWANKRKKGYGTPAGPKAKKQGRWGYIALGVFLTILFAFFSLWVGKWATTLAFLQDPIPFPGSRIEVFWEKLPETKGEPEEDRALVQGEIVYYDELRFDFNIAEVLYSWDRREPHGRWTGSKGEGTWSLTRVRSGEFMGWARNEAGEYFVMSLKVRG